MANSSKINTPKHVGIIMDGNGRWAIKNSLKISEGHKKGVSIVKDIVEESVKQDLSSLTIYAFSTENWKRPKAEVTAIKKLVIDAINDQVPELKEQRVRLKFFGNTYDFGKKVIDKIDYAEQETHIKKAIFSKLFLCTIIIKINNSNYFPFYFFIIFINNYSFILQT